MPATLPPGMRRCSAPSHEGKRLLPESEFQRDRAQASGFRSWCKGCVNADKRVRYARHTDRADAKDEDLLDEAEAEALKLAAERERRRASDFEVLKPDDFSDDDSFNTGVANDRGSRKLSHRASMEKRQEFSKQMGEHAVDLRRAAIKDMNGDGKLEEDMTPESGSYIGKLAEQERRFGNRRLARSVSLFSAGEELHRRLWIQACKQYLSDRVVPTGYAKKPPSGRMKRSVCLMLSDLHMGAELDAATNPIPFRKVEEARRLEYVMRQAIDYKPQYRKDSELVLMINGDVIDGMLLHDFRDGAPLVEQEVVFQRAMERFIGECARAFPKVRVFCQPGNHGRNKLRHPGRATSSKWDGIEWRLYHSLSRACAGLKNVEWDLPFRAICKIDLHGSWFLLSHGDTEVKLGDPDAKAKENLAVLDKINSTRIYGVEFAAAGFGHFHKPRYLPSRPRVLFNGALVPPNGHARSNAYIGEPQGQWLWEAVEGYPIGDARFIEVGQAQDHDERLGTIIEPFRFSLE